MKIYEKKKVRLCLVIVFFFLFSKTCFWENKEKKISYIFEIKNIFS